MKVLIVSSLLATMAVSAAAANELGIPPDTYVWALGDSTCAELTIGQKAGQHRYRFGSCGQGTELTSVDYQTGQVRIDGDIIWIEQAKVDVKEAAERFGSFRIRGTFSMPNGWEGSAQFKAK